MKNPEITSTCGIIATLIIAAMAGGCVNPTGPITVSVFSSRMAISSGTNDVHQQIEGGGVNASSNETTATMPVGGLP